jgi:alkanesulfonate monooxygenase SsuD/methylene tetrahydromethanopterin reductase-like flavin-dependent oxidoreductase (luciferase family)
VSLSFGWCLWKEGTANFDRAPGAKLLPKHQWKKPRKPGPVRRALPAPRSPRGNSKPPGWAGGSGTGTAAAAADGGSPVSTRALSGCSRMRPRFTRARRRRLRRVNVTATCDGLSKFHFTSHRTARSSRMLPSTAASSALARWSPQPIVSAQYSTGRDGLAGIGASTFIRRGEGTSMAPCGRRGGRGTYRPPLWTMTRSDLKWPG